MPRRHYRIGMEPNERIRVLEISLNRTNAWIGAAEGRAPLILAIATAMLGALAASMPVSADDWSVSLKVLASLTSLLGILALVFVAASSFPRTKGPANSLIYFGGVAKISVEQFVDRINQLDQPSYILDLQHQCHRNAEIAAAKYRWIQRSKLALYGSVLPWLLAILKLRM